MEKTCDTCFYRDNDSSNTPCKGCVATDVTIYDKWVAIDFLSNVDNRPFVEHGAEVMSDMVEQLEKQSSSLNKQVSGSHYKGLKIQPIEFIHANNLPFAEGCVIKYLTRWRDKGGIADLEKAKHFIELLIELETRK